MSINYYHYEEQSAPCPTCGHKKKIKRLHIGKSSYGWAFSLHIIPHEGLNSLDDWRERWKTGVIRNEYMVLLTDEEMERVIINRDRNDCRHDDKYASYGGPTWDHVSGDFS